MSKLSVAIVGLVGCAIGLLLGLGVAALVEGKPPVEKAADASPAVEADGTPAPIDAGDWGPLQELPEAFGPGTPAFELIDYLTRHGSWIRNEKTGGPPLATFAGIGAAGKVRVGKAYLELTQIGDGKVRIEAVVLPYQWLDGQVEVIVQHGIDGGTSDPELALTHRGRVFRLITEGLGMPEDARKAAQQIERAVPWFWTSQQKVDGMAYFCQYLRPSAVSQLQKELRQWQEIDPAVATPRVGFTLSERWVMEVIFARDDPGHFYSGETGFNSGAWAFLLGGPKSGQSGPNSWPRLTEAETAAFLQRLGER